MALVASACAGGAVFCVCLAWARPPAPSSGERVGGRGRLARRRFRPKLVR